MWAVALASSDAGSDPSEVEEQEASAATIARQDSKTQRIMRVFYRLIARLRSSTVSSAALRFLGQMIRLRIGGIFRRDYVGAKRLHRIRNQRGRISVSAHELCRRFKCQIQNVVEHQHLAIAIRAGADADGRRLHLGRDHGRDFARNAFKIDAGHSRAVQSNGVTHELFDRRLRILP